MQLDTKRLMLLWYQRAQLDYSELYLRLFIAYNAWFRQVTGATNDRRGIEILKTRFVIWYDYQRGRVLQELRPTMERLVAKMAREGPFAGVRVEHVDDWRGLIEFWYQVRCHLFHGSEMVDYTLHGEWIELAYYSLNSYMTEIITRIEQCFTPDDAERLQEIRLLARHDPELGKRLLSVQWSLERKYIHSPEIWNVDMAAA